MRTLYLACNIFAVLLSLIAIALTLNRIYLNQAAGAYSDQEMLMLVAPAISCAFFAALTINHITEKK